MLRSTAAVLGLVFSIATSATAQRNCPGLTSLRLERAAITSAALVAAGRYTPPENGLPGEAADLPQYCRVRGVARPTADSEIRFEVWLPIGTAWNGKYQQVGNGGYSGIIPEPYIATGVARGYATAGTDDGHVGQEPSFAIGHPEKVIDFGSRSIQETARHAKRIVEAFYGKSPSRSYFVGCSNGGRQALMAAQRFPADFDGIVAGAPANDWVRLFTAGMWNWRALTETPASMIPVAKLATIQSAVVAACDQLDGVRDGLIDDPRRCRFDPASIRCRDGDSNDCLTAPQVATLEKIYLGPRDASGKAIYPGAAPGVEAIPGNWDTWVVPDKPDGQPLMAFFATSFYQSMVFEQPSWNYRAMNFDRDFATAATKLSKVLDATDANLGPFRARGGKLIQYHGWGDAAIPAASSIEYYERVLATVARPVDDFYRLFMVPGLGHCGGGVGPTSFGNEGVPEGKRPDPERDVVVALERWVEKGVAPERLIGTGVRLTGSPTEVTKVAKLTRLLCPYPKRAAYSGKGDIDDARSYACRA